LTSDAGIEVFSVGKDGGDDCDIQLSNGAGVTKVKFSADTAVDNYIIGGGGFGIGTTAPVTKLHISDNAKTTQTRLLTLSSSVGSDGSGCGIAFVHNDGDEYAQIQGTYKTGSTTIRGLTFWTGAPGSTTEKMVIDDGGLVGIGTSSPKSTLHVRGGASGQSCPWPLDGGIFESDDHLALSLLTPNNKYARICFGDSDSSIAGYIAYAHSISNMDFVVEGARKMTLTATGAGFGTLTPRRYLEVSGGSEGAGVGPFGGELVISDNNNVDLAFTCPNTYGAHIYFGDPEDNDIGSMKYEHSDNSMEFTVNTAIALSINSSGKTMHRHNCAELSLATSDSQVYAAGAWTMLSGDWEQNALDSNYTETGGRITVVEAGRYLVTFDICGQSASASVISWRMYIDAAGGTDDAGNQIQCKHLQSAPGTYVGHDSSGWSRLVTLTANQVLDVRAYTSAAETYTYTSASFRIQPM